MVFADIFYYEPCPFLAFRTALLLSRLFLIVPDIANFEVTFKEVTTQWPPYLSFFAF